MSFVVFQLWLCRWCAYCSVSWRTKTSSGCLVRISTIYPGLMAWSSFLRFSPFLGALLLLFSTSKSTLHLLNKIKIRCCLKISCVERYACRSRGWTIRTVFYALILVMYDYLHTCVNPQLVLSSQTVYTSVHFNFAQKCVSFVSESCGKNIVNQARSQHPWLSARIRHFRNVVDTCTYVIYVTTLNWLIATCSSVIPHFHHSIMSSYLLQSSMVCDN